MYSKRKQMIHDLLKGIETGDPESVKVVNEKKYIQHNPQTSEGGDGLAVLFKRLSKTNPKVEIVRLFEDGDYVFGHTIYDFSSVRIGFEIFRYEGDKVVEHWDNIQTRIGDMVGGTITSYTPEKTEKNRMIVKDFITNVCINKNHSQFKLFIDEKSYTEHSTLMNISEKYKEADYKVSHRVLADGNFVLSVSEGYMQNIHYSFYDLFRVEKEIIVEHWDTNEKVAAKVHWKNNNGKF
jgi:predicted SnoaL-like aldol condensation-catalyzing enzyme